MRKNHFRYLNALLLMMTVTILTGCYPRKYYTPKVITIETTPEASVFWHGGTFDGRYIQTADSEGVVKTGTSEYWYRKYKQKKVLIAKEGYEPVELKLATKFNTKVLRNLLFPPAFLWGKYITINLDKKSRKTLSVPSRHTAAEYFETAQKSKGKQQKEMLKMALYQDPVNRQGIGKQAAGILSDIYFEKKEYNTSAQYAATMLGMSPKDDESSDKLKRANLAIAEKAARKQRRLERFTRFGQYAQTFSTALAANTAAINGSSSSTDSQRNSSVSSQSSKRNKNKNTKTTSLSSVQNERTARKTYNDYVSQLASMKAGLDAYDDNTRRTIQSKMKEIRQRWGFPMAELENWNGSR